MYLLFLHIIKKLLNFLSIAQYYVSKFKILSFFLLSQVSPEQ